MRPFTSSVFGEISAVALARGAIDLGQGFPDYDGPEAMLDLARSAIAEGMNQYSPADGHPALLRAVTGERARRLGSDYDPSGEALVTAGATEALTAAILALVEPGDEVVLIEPYYDSYAAAVALAGARRRTVSLTPDGAGFAVDLDALRAAVTSRTSLLVVNSPHNPTGLVLSTGDLAAIADIACEHDLLVLSDEVYERLVFPGGTHTSIASLPGMRERTIVVSGAAKTFNVTGWKIGWALAPERLIDALRATKQYLSFVPATPFQPAVAYALEYEDVWVAGQRDALWHKYSLLSTALREAGYDVKRSAGGYFVCADVGGDGIEFCRRLPVTHGTAAIPVAALADTTRWNTFVRFAFCKRDETLRAAAARLVHSGR